MIHNSRGAPRSTVNFLRKLFGLESVVSAAGGIKFVEK
jgi:hypothetical protein